MKVLKSVNQIFTNGCQNTCKGILQHFQPLRFYWYDKDTFTENDELTIDFKRNITQEKKVVPQQVEMTQEQKDHFKCMQKFFPNTVEGIPTFNPDTYFSSSAYIDLTTLQYEYKRGIPWMQYTQLQGNQGYLNLESIVKDPRQWSYKRREGRGIPRQGMKGKGIYANPQHWWKISPFYRQSEAPYIRIYPQKKLRWEDSEYEVLCVDDLRRAIEMGRIRIDKKIDVLTLKNAGIVGPKLMDGVYIVPGKKDLPFKIDIKVQYCHPKAKEQILRGGGQIVNSYNNRDIVKAKSKPQWFETEGRFKSVRDYLPGQWRILKYKGGDLPNSHPKNPEYERVRRMQQAYQS